MEDILIEFEGELKQKIWWDNFWHRQFTVGVYTMLFLVIARLVAWVIL